jgi:hypothetical protein
MKEETTRRLGLSWEDSINIDRKETNGRAGFIWPRTGTSLELF